VIAVDEMLRFRISEALSRRTWVIPLTGVGVGIGLSFATVAIDRHYHSPLLPSGLTGNATDAEQILATIAAAVVPLTTTVLTVTLVAIQLAMGQFSPRIVRALLDDRRDQLAIAVFGATFTFCLFSLRAIDTGPGAPVPGVTICTAFVLTIASGAALFLFVNHAGHRLRVAGLVDLVGDQLVALSDERTHNDDPAYGFRKLVDVAQRALGTAQNDATTAVQVINRLHDCLRQLAPRPFPPADHVDDDGQLRLVVRSLDWDGYVRLAFDEIRLAAGPYPQATRRLQAALQDLKAVAPQDRRPPLERQLRLLEQAVEHGLSTQDDIRAALIPDAQGIGSGVDVVLDGSARSRT
jgi:uncharacterized membrane protein